MKRTHKFDAARDMPPLRHTTPRRPFDITESDVCKWLCSQPEIMQYVFDRVASGGSGAGLIVYDPETGTWAGVDHEA